MMRKLTYISAGLILFVSCSEQDLIEPAGFGFYIEADSVVFAVIGDYGVAGTPEQQVADLVNSWDPDFIITTGDNNYTDGKLNTIKENISNYYGDYIYNYDAPKEYRCAGKAYDMGVNRFFPCPGNHDANNRDGLIPYYNFFTLPERESYYKFTWGPVTFYSLNSEDGTMPEQAVWLERQLIKSKTPFNIAYSHAAPYSCGSHGNHEEMQLNYYGMGVDIVLSGHDHIYSKIQKTWEDGLYYIINGLGGRDRHACNVFPLSAESFTTYCYNQDFGAIRASATSDKLILEFYTISTPDHPLDRVVIDK